VQPVTDDAKAILTGPTIYFGYGVDLLDSSLNFVEDISADVKEATVRRDCTAVVHGSCEVVLTDKLAPQDLIRPWATASDGVNEAKFYMGVHSPKTPTGNFGTSPLGYHTLCFDPLSKLDKPLAQPWTISDGETAFTNLQALYAQYGMTVPLVLDPAGAAKTWTGDKTWPNQSGTTGLTVFNAILAGIAFQALWADWLGSCRSGPFVAASARNPEWDIVIGDPLTGTWTDTPQITNPIYETPNQFPYVMNGVANPVDGTSATTINNLDQGPSSQHALGEINTADTKGLDSTDFDDFLVQAQADAAAQIRATEQIQATGRRLLHAWHNDILTYSFDALGVTRLVQGRQWEIVLHDISAMSYTFETINQGSV
jgi:hypothetical protein